MEEPIENNLAYQYAVRLVEKYQVENRDLKRKYAELEKRYYNAIGMKIGKKKTK